MIGCSSGTLVIWNCLHQLAQKGELGKGIISGIFYSLKHLIDTNNTDTIILGAPIATKPLEWEEIRSVVSGRLINGWTESDWVLGLLCHDNVAGTSRVNWQHQEDKRLVNIRLTGTISGHTDYQQKMSKILSLIDACQDDFKIDKICNSGKSNPKK